MATVGVDRDGSTATVATKTLATSEAARQFAVLLGESMPALGTGNEILYIGQFVGTLNFGIAGLQFTAEFDWLRGGVILVTGNAVQVQCRRDDANVGSTELISVSADIQDVRGTEQKRPLVRPQRTLSLAATGQGGVVPIGTLPKFANRIIGVTGTLLLTADFELRLERNDDTTIVHRASFSTLGDFGAVDIPIPVDATRIIGAEIQNGIGDDVENVRVVFELAIP